MSDALVHYDNDSGRNLYVQFDGDEPIRVQYVEGSGAKLRRYAITNAALAGVLPAGTYNPSVRVGSAASPDDADEVVASFGPFRWDGAEEIPPISTADIPSPTNFIVNQTPFPP